MNSEGPLDPRRSGRYGNDGRSRRDRGRGRRLPRWHGPLWRRALRHGGPAGSDLPEGRRADRREARLQGRGVCRDQLQRRDRGDAQRQARNRRVRAAGLCARPSGGEGRGGRRLRHRRRQAQHLLGQHRHLPWRRASRRSPRSRGTASRSPTRPRPPAICSRPTGCARPGSTPTRTSSAIFAGSHTASFEALYNHKVDAGELNSEQLESAKQRGHYKDGDLVFLWKSDPIPTDPFAVRGDLPPRVQETG